MSEELLDLPIATTGGHELRNTLRGLKVDLSTGRPIWAMKGRPADQTFDQAQQRLGRAAPGLLPGYACWNRYQTSGGLLVATRRRVFRRNPDNTVNLNLPSITLDIHDVELVRSDSEQAQL